MRNGVWRRPRNSAYNGIRVNFLKSEEGKAMIKLNEHLRLYAGLFGHTGEMNQRQINKNQEVS